MPSVLPVTTEIYSNYFEYKYVREVKTTACILINYFKPALWLPKNIINKQPPVPIVKDEHDGKLARRK